MKRAVLVFLLACGGAPKSEAESPKSAAKGAADSPAERCLAIAGAKHEKRANEPARIGAKHVLVKYAGSKRAAASITRTREEACLRAEEARKKLESGASFGEVVAAYSDEPGAASREGSVGTVGRSDVAAPFADAAFELAPGEVSQVVESDFGFHVILRTE